MTDTHKRHWLVCYDITCPRRLGKVHRLLSKQARLVQYSVYACFGSRHDMRRLATEIEALIDPGSDDVRIYPLPQRLELYQRGMQPLEGLHLYGDKADPFHNCIDTDESST